ncbi:TolC family protein [Mariluticola halotolerans]|uniref:TolC family protein n=1 Tax=Mariluticola halotolerans TaxID=2909283 RepID=UPI0026E1E7E5|nr:TolC family protein [Mariluticola halotolerans]UJQ95777.1 TolC family protein [Mariluticola halotolerans]
MTTALMSPSLSYALSLKDAVGVAMETNPEIGQAVQNREATEFELKQALGLYMPRVDLEASTGIQRLDNSSRRGAGIENDPLYPTEIGVVATYDILDGGFRESEAHRQAARIDSASFRVLERSELTALEVARLYFEILLQGQIVELARENLSFHESTLGNVSDAITNGQLTEADRQQATERRAAAKASVLQAQEALEAAKIGFEKQVGAKFTRAALPSRVGRYLPPSLSRAIEVARQNNPRVRIASADLDAAAAMVDQASGARGPKLSLEGRAKVGSDISGTATYTTDLQGRLVLRWNIFDGGIKDAKVQENIRRESEAMYAQKQAGREVDEAVRVSWDRIHKQGALAAQYNEQLSASNGLVSSYREQFTIGQRSLLDVLDAQNTRYNVQVLARTASYSARFAEYRLMAATGTLLSYLGLAGPEQATAYAREMLHTPSAADAPPRDVKPIDFKSPLDLTAFVK